jgi:hypothetical protein
MNSNTESAPPAGRAGSRMKLLAIFAVVAMPILVAWIMAKSGVGVPTERNNRSDLVEPNVTVQDWGVSIEPLGYGSPWRLAVTTVEDCQQACLDLIHEARQINVALGREAGRVEHLLLSAQLPDTELVERLERDYPRLEQSGLDPAAYQTSLRELPSGWSEGPQLWLIDPLGRVVLRQDPGQPGKRLLDDLKHLLKVSKVG